MKVRYAPAAMADIDDIFSSIAPNNPVAAQHVEDMIQETAERLGRFPGVEAGTDLGNVRRIPLVRYPYTIYYRINATDDSVEVLRIVHAATIKDLRRLPD